MRGFCGDASLLDLSSPCVRATWSALGPAAIVAAVLFLAIPLPQSTGHALAVVGSPFKQFLTLKEAESLLTSDAKTEVHHHSQRPTLWRTLVLSLTTLVETLAWLAIGSYILITGEEYTWSSLLPFLVAMSWLYACCRSIFKPAATPPYDLFALFIVRLFCDVVVFGGMLYDRYVYDLPLRDPLVLCAQALNLAVTTIVLVTILTMPLDVPSSSVDSTEIVRISSKTSMQFAEAHQRNRESRFLRKSIRRCGAGSVSIGSSH